MSAPTSAQFLTTRQLAELLGTTAGAVNQQRRRGFGPAFVRVGPKLVRYRREDVAAWVAANTQLPGSPNAAANDVRPLGVESVRSAVER